MRIVSVLMLGLAACGLSEEKFMESANRVSCEKYEECEPEEFGAMFDSQAACRDFFDEMMGIDDDDDDINCTFDAAKASACISELRSASCEDLDRAGAAPSCDEVYECDFGTDDDDDDDGDGDDD